MDCNEIQMMMMEGKPLDDSCRRHVDHCGDCAAVERLCQMIAPRETAENSQFFPDEKLDASVLKACRAEVSFLPMRRRLRFLRRSLYAAAAAVVLLLSVKMLLHGRIQSGGEAFAMGETWMDDTADSPLVMDASVLLNNEVLENFNAELACVLAQEL